MENSETPQRLTTGWELSWEQLEEAMDAERLALSRSLVEQLDRQGEELEEVRRLLSSSSSSLTLLCLGEAAIQDLLELLEEAIERVWTTKAVLLAHSYDEGFLTWPGQEGETAPPGLDTPEGETD